jgi:DNA-binding response OmpR family regulator
MKQHSIAQPFAKTLMDRSYRRITMPRPVSSNKSDTIVRFRRFCVLPRTRQLLAEGTPVEVGSRAFDLLMVLVEARGDLVSNDEIMDRVWPTTLVDETNVRVQMSRLRKSLGKDGDIIKTVPGRGYVFVAPVTTVSNEVNALTPAGSEPAQDGQVLQSALSSTLGRQSIGSGIGVRHKETQLTVAVIDDDPEVREALQGLLQSVGLRVQAFGAVQEFLAEAGPGRFGCLVLDVRLPGQSGLDFFDGLTKANIQLPVIFISGYADVPMSVRAMKAGAFEFLTKPVRDQDLLDAIQLAIGSRLEQRPETQ